MWIQKYIHINNFWNFTKRHLGGGGGGGGRGGGGDCSEISLII